MKDEKRFAKRKGDRHGQWACPWQIEADFGQLCCAIFMKAFFVKFGVGLALGIMFRVFFFLVLRGQEG